MSETELHRSKDSLDLSLQPVAMVARRFVRLPLSKPLEQFHQARLVRITRGRLAIWLDPFGMLDPQAIVNLFPQLCAGLVLLKRDH